MQQDNGFRGDSSENEIVEAKPLTLTQKQMEDAWQMKKMKMERKKNMFIS